MCCCLISPLGWGKPNFRPLLQGFHHFPAAVSCMMRAEEFLGGESEAAMRTTWLGQSYVWGTQHPTTPPRFWPGKAEEGFAAAVPPLLSPCWVPATPPRLQGDSKGEGAKPRSALQGAACKGCPVPAPHMNPPHSSSEALLFTESNAGLGRAEKLPSPVAEIHHIKPGFGKEASQMDHFLAMTPLPTPSLSTPQTPQHRAQQRVRLSLDKPFQRS